MTDQEKIKQLEEEAEKYKYVIKGLWEICVKYADKQQLVEINTAMITVLTS
jgi:hypothetical protein